MHKKYMMICLMILPLFLVGCSKHGMLMPGKSQSDCENGKLGGICGHPDNLYTYRENIMDFKPKKDRAYTINDDGDIIDLETGEVEKFADKRQRQIDESVSEYYYSTHTEESSSPNSSTNSFSTNSVDKDLISGSNNLVLSNHNEGIPILDNGKIRRLWVNSYKTKDGNAVMSPSIMYIVTKKPRLLIGEDYPTRVTKRSQFPSVLSQDILKDSHISPTRYDEKNIESFTNEERDTSLNEKELEKITKFLEEE
jgi:hypothetical protein